MWVWVWVGDRDECIVNKGGEMKENEMKEKGKEKKKTFSRTFSIKFSAKRVKDFVFDNS